MEYERIHQVQTGIISPSKLRMKLMGPHHHQKKKKGGSNSNSSRTSPAKLNEEDTDLFNNSLLETANGDFEEQQQVARNVPKTDPTDDNLDYDSNASSSSFEFHKGGERSLHHSMAVRSFSRPIPSKWNNADKWIMNRQITNFSKKPHHPHPHPHHQVQTNHRSAAMSNLVRVAPDSSLSIQPRVDFCGVPNGENPIIDLSPDKDLVLDIVPAVRSVCMRDMGTEMTPVPSQEPSRSVTPVSSTTPIRSSPTSSLPTTPRRGATTAGGDDDNCKKELSEEEMKMKTRREIVALGVHLGKLNIAAWASKDEDKIADSESEKMEFQRRAAAWEEAENSKHAASYKREEIKIEAWESQQKAKLEGEMRRMEAKIEQMRAHSKSKILKKIGIARQKSEEKRVWVEARKQKDAERTGAQAEYIRRTGRIPTRLPLACCGW
ncbi:uncharacterized protein LOC124914750 [Impatiens glandulifera]|uniref:uncharacterized protein LOC124914750 n=1 Tax=Impatiens glandulifera TaxID=253017 RepID=UPI001FB0C807|nr:uncharacterized protein LOC124914750 [Impatiens glandulifera]